MTAASCISNLSCFGCFNWLSDDSSIEQINAAFGVPRETRIVRDHTDGCAVAVQLLLAGSPSILLADEPTGNLDSHNANSVMELTHGIRISKRQAN